MQKEKSLGHATVQVLLGRMELLRKVGSFLPKTVKIHHQHELPATKNQNSISFEVTYGPVWGGWECDIKKHFTAAARKAGTSATVNLVKYKREVVETRPIC